MVQRAEFRLERDRKEGLVRRWTERLLEADTGLVYRQKLAMGLRQFPSTTVQVSLLQLRGNQRNQGDNLGRAQGSGSRNAEHPGPRLRVASL